MQKSCRVSVQPERPQVAVVPRQRLLRLEPPRLESRLARDRRPGAATAAPAILRARVPAKESGTCSIDNDSRVDGSTATVLVDLSGRPLSHSPLLSMTPRFAPVRFVSQTV